MAYKAIVSFTDLQDNNYRYVAGDIFPRDGVEVSAERLESLLTTSNRRNEPMIVEVEDNVETVIVNEEANEKPAQKKAVAKKSGRKKKADAE